MISSTREVRGPNPCRPSVRARFCSTRDWILGTSLGALNLHVSRRSVAHYGAPSEGGADSPGESPELIMLGSRAGLNAAVTFPVTHPVGSGQRWLAGQRHSRGESSDRRRWQAARRGFASRGSPVRSRYAPLDKTIALRTGMIFGV